MKPSILLAAAALLLLGLSAVSHAGGKITPVHLDKVNTADDEVDPFTLDGTTLYYASNTSGAFGIYQSSLVKRAAGKETWSAGKVYDDMLSKEYDHRSPFLRKDRQDVLYYAMNEVPDPLLAKHKNFDICRKIGTLAPARLLAISEKSDETHPWITPDGMEFYFSRKTAEGWKLFMATGPTVGQIGKEMEVGFPPGFHNATFSTNKKGEALVMYLQGPLENGRWGLYRSKRDKVGAKWSKPVPLTQVNNADGKRGDITPCLTDDGKRLFFASDRPGGKGGMDIWYVYASQLK